MMRLLIMLTLSSLLALTPLVVVADDSAPGATVAVEKDYSALKERWQKMSPEQRDQLRHRFNNFKQLPPERQERIRNRLKQFQKLPPEDQERLRHRWQRWQKMPPHEKQRMRKRFERFQQLPPASVNNCARRCATCAIYLRMSDSSAGRNCVSSISTGTMQTITGDMVAMGPVRAEVEKAGDFVFPD